MKHIPIIVEQQFDVSIEVLWRAITEKDLMVQWFFENIPDFKAEIGFKTEFLVENEGRKFTHQWEIIEVIPKKRIVYSWQYKEYPGEGKVYFDISEESDTVKLTLTNVGLETFPDTIPEFKRASCEGGWNYFIKNRLKSFLEKSI